MTTTRRLAAILAADVAGYSRLMAADEVGTLEALKAARRDVVDPTIAEHNGRIVKTTGDGMLVEFASAVDAVTCGMAVQEMMAARSGALSFRIGINVGDIMIDGDDIFGDGVNVAARVEGECEPGNVCLSSNAVEQVRNKTSFAFDDLGEKLLKNIDRPIRIYGVRFATGGPASVAWPEPGKPLPLPDKPSIAVLPFQNMSGDPEQEYFADGMVEDIITALSRFKQLFVIARNSSFTYKGKTVDIKQVGRELGVRYVLEGSVRKAGGRVRITGQLIEAATNNHLWADRFDGALEDVFELQDKVTMSVIGALVPAVYRAEFARTKLKRPDSLDAWDLVVRARNCAYNWRVGAASLLDAYQEVVSLCMQAIQRSPDYALPYARAAGAHAFMYLTGVRPYNEEQRREVLQLAVRATQLAPSEPEVLFQSGFAMSMLGSVERGVALCERAASLNPNLSGAWHTAGWSNMFLGNHELAIQQLETAHRLNPVDPDTPNRLAAMSQAHFLCDRFEKAYSLAELAFLDAPDQHVILRALAASAAMTDRLPRAQVALQRLLQLFPQHLDQFRGLMRRQQDVKLIFDALRIAGLPE